MIIISTTSNSKGWISVQDALPGFGVKVIIATHDVKHMLLSKLNAVTYYSNGMSSAGWVIDEDADLESGDIHYWKPIIPDDRYKKYGWLYVFDDLPVKNQSVVYYFDSSNRSYLGKYFGGEGWDSEFGGRHGFLTGDVMFWMPVIEPPLKIMREFGGEA